MQNQMQNKEKISKNVNQKNVIKLKKEQIKKHKTNSKKQSGITLIALVITIALNCVRSGRKLEYTA